MTVLGLLDSPKLISRKIWMTEKSCYFHTEDKQFEFRELYIFNTYQALALSNRIIFQVIAVAARNLKSAEDFAAKFDIKKAYGSYKELANDPYVEVVYVGSINTTHLEICKMLLNHDKHVLCEKPLGMNVKETEEMLKLAQKKKLFFMEAIWSRQVK